MPRPVVTKVSGVGGVRVPQTRRQTRALFLPALVVERRCSRFNAGTPARLWSSAKEQ